ncbi:MAG: hypothetical protein ACXVXC_00600 [Nocardioidaceae bacterium]
MQIEKETVADKLRAQGDYDRAQQAEVVLPRHVDTERDAGLLHALDLSVGELERDEQAAPS